jgi:hypothetical protein
LNDTIIAEIKKRRFIFKEDAERVSILMPSGKYFEAIEIGERKD